MIDRHADCAHPPHANEGYDWIVKAVESQSNPRRVKEHFVNGERCRRVQEAIDAWFAGAETRLHDNLKRISENLKELP